MNKISLFFICGSSLLLSQNVFAKLSYRSGADLLSENSQAIEFEGQSFSKTSGYDNDGNELISNEGTSFEKSDWNFKYIKGFFNNFEGTLLTSYRSVKSQTITSTATSSGLESVGASAKYLFFSNNKFSHVAGLHLKKKLFSNVYYELPTLPPSEEVVLGNDGLELGVDYYITYTDKFFNYDFKLGYNKPSANLSSELIYNTGVVYKNPNFYLLAGLGGTHSLKNDAYTNTPDLRPNISVGESRSFNALNGEKNFLYAGVQVPLGNFIIGLEGETIYSGRASDKGNTISLKIRWEKVSIPTKIAKYQVKIRDSQKYFAQGLVALVSKSGKMLKINIGAERQLSVGVNVDIFSINDYERGIPIATGTVIKVGYDWSIIKLTTIPKDSVIPIGSLVKAYESH